MTVQPPRAHIGRRIDTAGAIACAALTLFGYFAIVRPFASERATLVAVRGQVATAERKKRTLKTTQRGIKTDLATVRRELEASPVKLEPVSRLNHRLALIEQAAEESGLLIHETRSSEVVSGDRFDAVPIEVSGAGSFPECARFLHRLQQELPEVEVIGFALSVNPGNARSRQTFRFDLAWYATPLLVAPRGSRP